MSYVLILSTTPSKKVAKNLAQLLLQKKLAACINIVPSVESHYLWKGKIEKATEQLLFIKTRKTLAGKAEQALQKAHPYDTPEVVTIPITSGSRKYLSWITKETKS